MLKLLVGLIASLALFALLSNANSHKSSNWLRYKIRFGKNYAEPKEDSMRQRIFSDNKAQVERHNSKLAGERSYTKGLNHMSDMWLEDRSFFEGTRRLLRAGATNQLAGFNLPADMEVPDQLDWRSVPGRVGPVKDMDINKCANGYWAFAITGLLEGQQIPQNVSRDGKIVLLSEQVLLDCSNSTRGCNSGWPDDGLEDLAAFGMESEQSYPYNPPKSECKLDSSKTLMRVAGSKNLDLFPDEEALKKVVASYGPVVVIIYKSANFDQYKSGVFVDDSCPHKEANTPMLLVGYGTDPEHGDYWLLKTPFGANWGEAGYMRFARNKDNMCSITNFAVVATF